VVVLGSSHAQMYSSLIDRICRELELPVAFFALSGRSVLFEPELDEFDQARLRWIREWQPAMVIVIERWDGRESWHETTRSIDRKLHALFRQLCPLVDHMLFVAQAPALQVSTAINLRGLITCRMNLTGKLPQLQPDAYESVRQQAVATAESAQIEFPNMVIIRADLPFYLENGGVRYASERKFFYADNDHLTDAGAEQTQEQFTRAIMDARKAHSPP